MSHVQATKSITSAVAGLGFTIKVRIRVRVGIRGLVKTWGKLSKRVRVRVKIGVIVR